MAENSKIEWTDHTFNPWVGCQKISPGCEHCYAEGWAKRSGRESLWAGARHRTADANWRQPLKWNRKAAGATERPRVFCASLADVFDNQVPLEWRAELWALIRETHNLDWIIVTKRIGNAKAMLPADWGDGYPNVWLLSTIVSQAEADRDIPKLLATPARVRGLSMEPLLESVDLFKAGAMAGGPCGGGGESGPIEYDCVGYVDWVICGGESGPYARPMHPDWARSLRDQCQAAGVPFFFKQWGEWIAASQAECPVGGPASRWMWSDGQPWRRGDGSRDGKAVLLCKAGKKTAGRLLDGRKWDEYPEVGGDA